MDNLAVFTILRDNFQKKDNLSRKYNNNEYFLKYFKLNCSINDIKSLKNESSEKGLFELFNNISIHLLEKYGYGKDFEELSWNQYGRQYAKYRNVDALLLCDNNAIVLAREYSNHINSYLENL